MLNVAFVGSFDPAHIGHLNTYQKATRILNQRIKICICYNEFKPRGMFSIDERIAIARALFHTNEINSFATHNEIKKLIVDSDLIVRGYRKTNEEAEKEYSLQLLTHFGLKNFSNRLYFVEIDDSYEGISSTMIRELAKTDVNGISKYFDEDSFKIVKRILIKKYKL